VRADLFSCACLSSAQFYVASDQFIPPCKENEKSIKKKEEKTLKQIHLQHDYSSMYFEIDVENVLICGVRRSAEVY